MANNYLALLKRVLSLIAANSSRGAKQQTEETGKIYYICDSQGKNALPEDHPEVVVVTELCREFAMAINNRDYTDLDTRAEYHLYTINHLVEMVQSKDEQSTQKHFDEYKLKCKYEGCKFKSVAFNPNLDQVEVIYAVSASIIEATEKYLQNMKIKGERKQITKEVPFARDYTLTLLKERGVWKINSFNAAEEAEIVGS